MGKLYVRTFWRFSRNVGEMAESGEVFFRWKDESVGRVSRELEVFDEETMSKIGRVDEQGRVFDNGGGEVGWIETPRMAFCRARVYAPTEERWTGGGIKWHGKARARLFAPADVRRLEWRKGGAALLLLLKARRQEEMSSDVDDLISNWDLVYPTSMIFTALLILPFVTSLLSETYQLAPWLGQTVSFILTAFLLWVSIFIILSLTRRQICAGRASYARDFRRKVLDLINRRTGLTGGGKGRGSRKMGFDLLGMIVCAGAAWYFLNDSPTLFPVAAAGAVAFYTLWSKASAEPWKVLPRYRTAPLPPRPEEMPDDADVETRTYRWRFDGIARTRDFDATLRLKRSNVQAARDANPFRGGSNPDRHQAGKRIVLEGETANEVRQLAYELRKIALENRLTEYEEIQNTLDFVQDIRYAFDKDSIDRLTGQALGILEYWRFPIETLFDENGDCDCKAALAAALFRLVGFRALFLVCFDPEVAHAAVAIEGAPDFPQSDFFTYEGRQYYFCETTGSDFTVGEQPSPGFAGRFEIINPG